MRRRTSSAVFSRHRCPLLRLLPRPLIWKRRSPPFFCLFLSLSQLRWRAPPRGLDAATRKPFLFTCDFSRFQCVNTSLPLRCPNDFFRLQSYKSERERKREKEREGGREGEGETKGERARARPRCHVAPPGAA